MDNSVQALYEGLVSVDRTGVDKILREAVEEKGITGMGETLMYALEKVGANWESGEVSLAQVYMSGVICEEILKTLLSESDRTDESLPVIGAAVYLDHHSLGMKIVSSLVRNYRYPVFDLGTGVDAEKIISKIREYKIQILLVSVLMFPSALAVQELSSRMSRECPEVPIVVGGAPFRLDRNLYKKVGACRGAGNAGEIFGILENLSGNLDSWRGGCE